MRALIMGAINDERTEILLDSGANMPAITEVFDRRLRLQRLTSSGNQIAFQGIKQLKLFTTSRATVKANLGQDVVY